LYTDSGVQGSGRSLLDAPENRPSVDLICQNAERFGAKNIVVVHNSDERIHTDMLAVKVHRVSKQGAAETVKGLLQSLWVQRVDNASVTPVSGVASPHIS
jgi:precorrin-6B methylase 2